VLSFDSADRSERLQGIGENLCDLDRVVKAIGEYRFKLQPAHAAGDEVTGSTLEASLAEIWKKVLGRPRIGINDNFFEAGGTSLKAVQLIAAIKKELKLTLAIVSLFECPTIRLLAAKLCATPGEEQGGAAATAAALRGRQRRYGALRRKAS
jgi:acyl carrier protein